MYHTFRYNSSYSTMPDLLRRLDRLNKVLRTRSHYLDYLIGSSQPVEYLDTLQGIVDTCDALVMLEIKKLSMWMREHNI